ncbi:MAG: type I-Fv CRISPR-associated protein Cas5fv [Methylococcales bacterium]|nr:type I-Fv CRISPR-associated protein Cas5fv [Methylococcales bacterium]
MRITIKYEASWRNSFLGGSNNEPVPKNGREFLGSMTALGKKDAQGEYANFLKREITKDTVMGVLNRLIGDQRKLYQSRQSADYFFAELEPHITFNDRQDRTKPINSEMVYIRNMTGNTDQNAFTGMIKANDPVFSESYANAFWGVLSLDIDQLCQFVNQADYQVDSVGQFDPISVLQQLEHLNGLKAIDLTDTVQLAVELLQKTYPDVGYKITNGKIKPIELYCSALYLQIGRLSQHHNVSKALTKSGGISGISKRGFTPKDFMNTYTTGNKKPIWGNPYMVKPKFGGQDTLLLTKANGTLDIQLDVSDEKARLLESMIENAGVSSFYMGKKGLAYVDNLRV